MTAMPLLVEHADGVDWVTLNRPDSLNALDDQMVDALNQYEKMPIQEAIDYVAAKRGLSANNLKNIRQRLRSKTSKDSGQPHYQAALTTIAAQPDPARAIRVQLAK